MKSRSLNTIGSHLLFCMAFMLMGGVVMGLAVHMYGSGNDMLSVSLFNAGAGVFTGAFSVASRSMGSIDPPPGPPAPTSAKVTETVNTVTETKPEDKKP